MNVDLKAMKVAVLVNAASGRCTPRSGDLLKTELARHGIEPLTLWCGQGDGVEAALDAIVGETPDLLIVLGGDGTIRSAAQRCADDGPLLLPLPGGTMNMVAGALYGRRRWKAALQAVVAAPAIRTVAGAEAAGRRFFAGAMFGQPTLLAEAREATRTGDLTEALSRGLAAVRGAFDEELTCVLAGGETVKGEVVSITCPLMQAAPAADGARLDVATADLETPADALRLVLFAPFRDWRADPAVARAAATDLQILSRAAIPGLLDGEQFSFPSPLTITSVPAAFRAIIPRAARS